ncbi:rsbT co-antagonist protein RsbR [Nannocystis exedens]|uniref:RsbT co-antagonist protein RsbR n=1 Tax=Nannocystis exedens TaxID=54 RepID=A0A1I1YTC6_9BACT|nr:STAS domain-containing protein [Nannocystis exedens]PCC70155.1 anti-anti-sigma factor [Nannocystis exedens]SFE22721.1 rsbT co-antagonist protein RsbR [Nannocystis exedens]
MSEASKLQGAPLIVIEVDPGLVVTAWNRRAELVFGTDAASAVGRPLAEVLPPIDADWSALLDEGDGAPRVFAVRRGEASWSIEAWSQVDRDGEGRPLGVRLYGHDVTARVAAEARATLETTMLRAIKENLDIALWATDERGVFLYQDGKASAAVGMAPHSLVGLNIFELYRDLGNTPLIERAMAGEPTRTPGVETHGLFWDTYYIPVPWDRPGDPRLVGVSLDITDLKRVEQELRSKLELIERQQEVIRVLATPIIEVWDGVLTMPIVGLIDTARTAEIMDSLLQAVTQTRARFAILDLTGVEVVDTGTASHLIKMIQAIRLLGAEGILTGIHPTIAQTIVALGVDLSHVAVYAKLRDALKHTLLAARKR